jgi:pantetheine-phosphate adenylyltransferase
LTKTISPGSLDPFHNGHLEIVEHARSTLGLGRPEMVVDAVSDRSNSEEVEMPSLVVDGRERVFADETVRGRRTVSHFEFELEMLQTYSQLSGVETHPYRPERAVRFCLRALFGEFASNRGDLSRRLSQQSSRNA